MGESLDIPLNWVSGTRRDVVSDVVLRVYMLGLTRSSCETKL